MAIHTYQVAGKFYSGRELVPSNLNLKKIIRLGIQGDEGSKILLDQKSFEIGKSKILYYDNAEVKSIELSSLTTPRFLIIDFTYEDFEGEE